MGYLRKMLYIQFTVLEFQSLGGIAQAPQVRTTTELLHVKLRKQCPEVQGSKLLMTCLSSSPEKRQDYQVPDSYCSPPIQPSNTTTLGNKFSLYESQEDTDTFKLKHIIVKIFPCKIIMTYLKGIINHLFIVN